MEKYYIFAKKFRKILLSAAILLAFSVFLFFFAGADFRYRLIRSPMVQQIVPSYRSLRKLSDIIFFPSFFRKTALSVYELNIEPENLNALNSNLPEPFKGALLDANRLEVNADFRAGDYQERVSVRYRGLTNIHWAAAQKSWRVNFPSESRFQGMKGLNFVLPYDRDYFIEPLNAYRAKKLGLNLPGLSFVRLRLNGKDAGVYLAWEQWSDKWLSRSGLPDSSNILAVDDGIAGVFDSGIPLFSSAGLSRWKSHTQDGKKFPELEALVELVEKADDGTFKKLIPYLVDLPKFYAWHTLRALSDSSHQSELANLVLVFNSVTGKFEFVPWELGMQEIISTADREYTRDESFELLSARVFSIPEFRITRDEVLRNYLTEENLKDDLRFYDELARNMRPEFLSDTSKFHSNLKYLSEVRRLRALVEEDFKSAAVFAGRSQTVAPPKAGETLAMPVEFKRFPEIGLSLAEFLIRNPQFFLRGKDTLVLGPGNVALFETVVVPPGFKVIVEAGTRILMDEGVSLVSYSPLEMRGEKQVPVRVMAMNAAKPWGSILILQTGKEKNLVRFAEISGGSGIRLNGITATGMVSVHNGDLEVANSVFSNSHDDDAINVKYGRSNIRFSEFSRTYSDAIDLDFNENPSIVEGNVFLSPIGSIATGGDAIDLSFSELVIRSNDIRGCTDKGISVGESSRPLISDNLIEGCDIGVAVKDLSQARLHGNIFKKNKIAVSAYQKKQEFGGGYATVVSSQFMENLETVQVDKYSKIDFLN